MSRSNVVTGRAIDADRCSYDLLRRELDELVCNCFGDGLDFRSISSRFLPQLWFDRFLYITASAR